MHFGSDAGHPGAVATESEALLAVAFRLVPERSLPTSADAESGAEAGESIMQRRGAKGAARGSLLVGKGWRVFVLIGLDRLRNGVGPGGVAGEATRIDGPQIPLRAAVDHPLRQGFAGTPGLGDSKAEGVAMIEVAEAVGGPEIGQAVRGVGYGAVDDAFDAGRGE